MQLKKYLKIWNLILLSSFLTACSSLETVVVKTQYVEKEIPIQERPRGVNLHDVKFYAVTKENIEEFLNDFENIHGEVVFFAISVPDYENLALNVSELKRYIDQQKALIVYYEDNIRDKEELPETTSEIVQEGPITSLKNTLGLGKNDNE